MNFLTNKFPISVEIDKEEIAINYDFRTCLKILLAFEDENLTEYEKTIVAISLFYKDIPKNVEEAVEKMIDFLNMGEKNKSSENEYRTYSLEKDSQYIYSGIQKTHNIDLNLEENMHFWKFMNLFMELDENCFFSQLVYLRKQKQKGKLTDYEKELYFSLGDVVEIKQKTLDKESTEKLNKFYDLLER